MHSLPVSDVVVSSARIHAGDAVILSSTSSYNLFVTEEAGRIVVPSTAFAGGLAARLKMQLRIGGVVLPGYLIMLPESETEEFPNSGYINIATGQVYEYQAYECTDYISVIGVVDIACKVQTSGSACGLYCYDSEKRPVRVLIGSATSETVHIVPDGSYTYIRASNLVNFTSGSLILYFEE